MFWLRKPNSKVWRWEHHGMGLLFTIIVEFIYLNEDWKKSTRDIPVKYLNI